MFKAYVQRTFATHNFCSELSHAEAYLEPSRTSAMEPFFENS